ncbi:MAG TPA: ABC transporter permease [Vicinamibacteria bacterium]
MRLASALVTDAVRGARSLLRSPGLAVAGSLTLALGIGAATALFSVVNAVLVRPLPYDRPETRVMIWSRWTGFEKTWVSEHEVLDYRGLSAFRQVAAWATDQVNLTGDGDPVRVGVATVTANAFPTLGADPLLGRHFRPEEERPGADAVVIVSYRLWQGRYGADPALVGRSILIDGQSRQVVGIMPRGFRLPTDYGEDAAEPTELWIPLFLDPASERGNHGLFAAAELAPGTTADQASAQLAALARSLTEEGLYPEAMRFSAFAVPLSDEIAGGVRPALLLLSGAVVLLLLIACANVAHLLLARAEVRRREIAIRTSLGADRKRLLVQLLAESLVLAVPSGLLGVVLAALGVRLFFASGLAGIPRAEEVGMDVRVLLFAMVVALGTTLLFGLAPARLFLGVHPADALRDGGRGATAGRGRSRLRGFLVVAETALSVVLLVAAGLLLQSLWALQRVELGFVPDHVLTARVSLPETGYEEADKVVAFYRQVLERVRAVPGVKSAGLIRLLPLGAPIGDWGLDVEGYVESPGHNAKGDWQVASDGALEALGERIVRGRSFAATDTTDGDQVGLVNETMARTYWPEGDAIGGRFRMGSNPARPWVTVVGVVADVRHNGVTVPIKEKFYRPLSQFHRSTGNPRRTMSVVLRTEGDPARFAGALRAAVRDVDPSVPLAAVRPMSEVVETALATPRLAGAVLAVFAGLAVVLSAIGLFGVLNFLVSQRRAEIGVRLALGAEPRDILRLVLGSGLRMSVAGALLGSVAAAALVRLLAGLLHDVRPHDPLTFAVVPVLLLAVAALASVLPAWRAARVDPATTLRAE